MLIINIIYYATGAKEFCTAINPGTLYRTIFIHDDDVATYDDGGVDDGNDDCIDGNDDDYSNVDGYDDGIDDYDDSDDENDDDDDDDDSDVDSNDYNNYDTHFMLVHYR